MRNKFIFALFMSIFVLIAGGCSPADNTHAMRMNYQSEWYTDEDFETATEMMIETLKELYPDRQVIRFVYAGDQASQYYTNIGLDEEEKKNNQEQSMYFFIHFEKVGQDEYDCVFRRNGPDQEWQMSGIGSSGANPPIPDELLPQEVINAREEVQERFVNE